MPKIVLRPEDLSIVFEADVTFLRMMQQILIQNNQPQLGEKIESYIQLIAKARLKFMVCASNDDFIVEEGEMIYSDPSPDETPPETPVEEGD